MKAYLAGYGCYLDNTEFKLLSDLPEEEIIKELYERAIEATNGWVGCHGFADEEYENFDSQEDYEEYVKQAVDENADYYLEEWDEEEHAPRCTYGYDTGPVTETWK